jgi:hypothetical protein
LILKKPKHELIEFDTVIIKKEGIGYLMKTFDKVGQYVTDPTGSVKIRLILQKYVIFQCLA